MNGEFTTAVKIQGNSGSNLCYVNLENFYVYGDVALVGDCTAADISNGAEVYINSCIMQGRTGASSSCIICNNDSRLNIKDAIVTEYYVGVDNPNVGSGCVIELSAVAFNNCTTDVKIDHPLTSGGLDGISNHSKIQRASDLFGWSFLDTVDGEFDITKKISMTFPDGTHTDLSTLLLEGSGMGVIEGGELTDGGGLNVDVASGFGYLDDNSVEVVKRIDWVSTTLSLTANAENYIYINSNGILLASTSIPANL